jgi:hypothetical protein
LDFDIATAAIPTGMITSTHNQFKDDVFVDDVFVDDVADVFVDDVADVFVDDVFVDGIDGTVTFCPSESKLTPVIVGSVGSVTPFIIFSKPVRFRRGKVTPLRTFGEGSGPGSPPGSPPGPPGPML